MAAWVTLGILTLQGAWLVAVPPYGGLDEFDHAYRAASVAQGQWLPSGDAPADGRGELVTVPDDIAEAAGPACDWLPYPGVDNCFPVKQVSDGQVTIASAASRYNPVFYWVVGTAASPFEGDAALYAMRVATALICALLVGLAAFVSRVSSRTQWPLVGLLAALTPVVVYSTAIAAPNGVELTAAAGLWTALAAAHSDPTRWRVLIPVAAVFAIPLTGVRGLGPLWLAMVLTAGVLYLGKRRIRAAATNARTLFFASGAVVVGATAAATAWIVLVGGLEADEVDPEQGAVGGTLRTIPMWFLQSIAAFPFRDEPAPTVVYATSGLVLLALVAGGVIQGDRHHRLMIGLVFVAGIIVPTALQMYVWDSAGPVWQGRYSWPLAMGVVFLSAAALERNPPRHRLIPAALAAMGLTLATAHAVSSSEAMVQRLHEGPWVGDGRWTDLGPWVPASLSVLGVTVWGAVLLRQVHGQAHPLQPSAPQD